MLALIYTQIFASTNFQYLHKIRNVFFFLKFFIFIIKQGLISFPAFIQTRHNGVHNGEPIEFESCCGTDEFKILFAENWWQKDFQSIRRVDTDDPYFEQQTPNQESKQRILLADDIRTKKSKHLKIRLKNSFSN